MVDLSTILIYISLPVAVENPTGTSEICHLGEIKMYLGYLQ